MCVFYLVEVFKKVVGIRNGWTAAGLLVAVSVGASAQSAIEAVLAADSQLRLPRRVPMRIA